VSATREFRDLIDGGWAEAAAGSTFDDIEPCTGDVVARVPAGGREDARRAIAAASSDEAHDEPQMRFGGVEDSGGGRFGGTAATHEFTELRRVTVQSGTRPFRF
jgi:acyl-CoA reductase-like NAD-dependent aldehyde dehydrogenase